LAPHNLMRFKPRTYLIWGVVWVLVGAFMVAQVGFWNNVTHAEFQDVNVFQAWSNFIATNHAMPIENSWQYPPGAAFLMLIPRLGGGHFADAFIAMMLAFDLLGLVLLAALASVEDRDVGVWVWLLAMPLLFILPILRFDLVPTVLGVAALVVIHRRPAWFGALAGLGGMVKVWPLVILFGEWDRRRLLISIGAALVTMALIFGLAAILFGDQFGFLANQGARGLQVEAVAALPWKLRQVVTGEPPHEILRFGTHEIESGPADALSSLLEWVSMAVLVAAAIWSLARSRAIRAGRADLTAPVVSRDFVFTIVLLLVVTSRVLSPQFMIWLVGLSAVVLTTSRTRVARPAWIVIGAVVLTAGLYQSPANFVIRNLALLVAAVDASMTLIGLLRDPHPSGRRKLSAGLRSAPASIDQNVAAS
jgi:Glycosyltransferase family 87